VAHPFGRRNGAWTLQTSSGKYWNPAHPGSPSQGRRWPRQTLARSSGRVLDGIMWIVRTGAPWKDLPERYPPYQQTCQRRFQRWIEEGVLSGVLEALAADLEERGEI
jgi:transposase